MNADQSDPRGDYDDGAAQGMSRRPTPPTFDVPCWWIDRDEWECPHFPTREEAEAERARYFAENDNEDGPIMGPLPFVCVVAYDEDEGFDVHAPPSAPDDASALL